MTTRPARAAVCPIVSTLLSSLGRTITPLERQRLVERWPAAMPQVGDDATLQRAAFLTDRAVRKYSTETMEAIKVPAMARHLTRVPDRDTAHKLTNEIANYLLDQHQQEPQRQEHRPAPERRPRLLPHRRHHRRLPRPPRPVGTPHRRRHHRLVRRRRHRHHPRAPHASWQSLADIR